MDNIFTKLSLTGLGYSTFLCFVYIYMKIKNAIAKKRNYIIEGKMTLEKLWGNMGGIKGKFHTAFFTASLFCFMFGNPFFRSITKTTNEKWSAVDLVFFILGVLVFLFSIITIAFVRNDDESR